MIIMIIPLRIKKSLTSLLNGRDESLIDSHIKEGIYLDLNTDDDDDDDDDIFGKTTFGNSFGTIIDSVRILLLFLS